MLHAKNHRKSKIKKNTNIDKSNKYTNSALSRKQETATTYLRAFAFDFCRHASTRATNLMKVPDKKSLTFTMRVWWCIQKNFGNYTQTQKTKTNLKQRICIYIYILQVQNKETATTYLREVLDSLNFCFHLRSLTRTLIAASALNWTWLSRCRRSRLLCGMDFCWEKSGKSMSVLWHWNIGELGNNPTFWPKPRLRCPSTHETTSVNHWQICD